MSKNVPILLSLLLIAIASSFTSCNLPTDPKVPVLNTGAGIPLSNKVYSLNDLLQDSSTFQKDGSNNLIFVVNDTLPVQRLSDSLKINDITFNYENRLNDANGFVNAQTNLGSFTFPITLIFSELPPAPSTQVINPTPAGGNLVSATPILNDDIEEARLRRARFRIEIINNLPIDAEIGIPDGQTQAGIVIETPGESTVFLPFNQEQRVIPAGQTRGLAVTPGGLIQTILTNQRLTQQSRGIAKIISTGSNGQPVSYTGNSVIRVNAFLDSLEFIDATLSVPSRTLLYTFETPFESGMDITQATLDSFFFRMDIQNTLAVSGQATLTAPQLTNNKTNQILTSNFPINAKSNRTVNVNSGGDQWTLKADPSDIAGGFTTVQKIKFLLSVVTNEIPKDDKKEFKESEGFVINGSARQMKLSFARGNSLPSQVTTVVTTSDIPSISNTDNFNFTEIATEKVLLDLNLMNGIGVDAEIEGTAELLNENNAVLSTVTIPKSTINTALFSNNRFIPSKTTLPLSLNRISLSAFPKKIRSRLTISTINSKPFAIADTNTISAIFSIKIPLAVRIIEGVFAKESEFAIGSELSSVSESIQSASLLFEAVNTIPLNVDFVCEFKDSVGNVILSLPKTGKFSLKGSSTNSEGYSNSSTKSFQRIDLTNEEFQILQNSKNLRVRLNFDAQNSQGGDFVRFRTTDQTQVRIFLDVKISTKE
jgi:hypothetical protein